MPSDYKKTLTSEASLQPLWLGSIRLSQIQLCLHWNIFLAMLKWASGTQPKIGTPGRHTPQIWGIRVKQLEAIINSLSCVFYSVIPSESLCITFTLSSMFELEKLRAWDLSVKACQEEKTQLGFHSLWVNTNLVLTPLLFQSYKNVRC